MRNYGSILRKLLCVECRDHSFIYSSFIHFIFDVPGSVLGTQI